MQRFGRSNSAYCLGHDGVDVTAALVQEIALSTGDLLEQDVSRFSAQATESMLWNWSGRQMSRKC